MKRLKKLEELAKARDRGLEARMPSRYAAYSDSELKKELDKILRESKECQELKKKLAGFTECQLLEIYALFCQDMPLDLAIRSVGMG